ncbi:MAG: T9SS type A sorting domain-containing protein [Candidatus Marinimicrobia bacterium]|nr:T9SS type A sorting domain-containing protein [Candidatus Neomarinimicrobiota bacterium]MBT4360146.1 T9SS type A sorting domain-containing protein [Candidatus Neomarinimicrobiota bacterium]MBT5786182.1 T9SS type A sorting domain-containing protein [Candidatus Neomarinimicrobiota bacterium]MBT6010348.1 T9SS type A sorting domain-containing protein [Candidatus Neomarinimicrobiota bacterium]MBT6302504.1 T9SS type A sorting domain-containing protein [Candidatus Neomarinimicrobiota bacterium]
MLLLHKRISLILILLVLLPGSLLFADGDTLSINIVIHDVVAVDEVFVPQEFALHPPYPNPFNPDVNLVVDIPHSALTRISIFNMRGQEIAVLENTELSPGRYTYQWQGSSQPSGIYFVRIQAGRFEKSEKISLLK